MKTYFLFLLVITTGNTFAQTGNTVMQQKIKQEAEKMSEFLFNRNYTAVAEYTYPKILEMYGSVENKAKAIENGIKSMSALGFNLNKVTIIGNPSVIVKAGNELQCTVPQTIEMKTPKGRTVANSTLIAISTDGGSSWYFVETMREPLYFWQLDIPTLSNELVIPAKEEPVLLKD